MLGDVTEGNGDPTLAVFGDNSTYALYPVVTPNVHTLVSAFRFWTTSIDPSRQSADGHNWIMQAIAPYADDIQSPDWLVTTPPTRRCDCLSEEGNLLDQGDVIGPQDEELRRVRGIQHVHRAGLHSYQQNASKQL